MKNKNFKVYNMATSKDNDFYQMRIKVFCRTAMKKNENIRFIEVGKNGSGSVYKIKFTMENGNEVAEIFENKWHLMGYIKGILDDEGTLASMMK